MEYTDEEELLNLSLAIVTDGGGERTRKRKRVDALLHERSYESCEGKIFGLLQMREEMLKPGCKRRDATEDGSGLHLIHLLLITATAVDQNKVELALENLTQLYRVVSLTGDSLQRVVAYFTDGLAARLLTRKSPFYDMIIKEPTEEEEFLAFTDLYRVSPYYQFAHFTANQCIIEAFEKEEGHNNRALHVVDFDVSYGFQWPSLIQSLSEKASTGNRISLRITGFGRTMEELQETDERLVSFSKGFGNLTFEFQGLLRGSKLVNLREKKNETLAINLVFYMNTLNNDQRISETLRYVRSHNPSIVVLVEKEGSRTPRTFLPRFMESLHCFAALFDSLDDCLPLESAERLGIEKNHLGKEIKSLLNHDDGDINCPRYERLEKWKARMENHGFTGIKLSSRSIIQAKLLLKIRTQYCPIRVEGESGGGFRVSERDDGGAISLGWQDRSLLTASAWQCR